MRHSVLTSFTGNVRALWHRTVAQSLLRQWGECVAPCRFIPEEVACPCWACFNSQSSHYRLWICRAASPRALWEGESQTPPQSCRLTLRMARPPRQFVCAAGFGPWPRHLLMAPRFLASKESPTDRQLRWPGSQLVSSKASACFTWVLTNAGFA